MLKNIISVVIFFYIITINVSSSIKILDVYSDSKTLQVALINTDTNYQSFIPTSKLDYSIFDNGKAISNFNFIEGRSPTYKKASIIFLFDLSIGNLPNTSNNRLVAEKFLYNIVSSIPDFEFSLIAFNSNSYFLNDFTINTKSILDYLPQLDISFGSDFDTAFFAYHIGAFEISDLAKYPVSILLITDKNRFCNYKKIIAKAQEKNIHISILMIGNEISEELKEIPRETSGLSFENLSLGDTTKVSSLINFIATGGKPDLLSWDVLPFCNLNHTETIVFKNLDTSTFSINIELTDFPELTANPPFLRFSSVIPGKFKDLDLNIVARNYDIRIDSAKISDPHFTIISGNIMSPIVLQKDQSHKFTIRFTPTDSAIVFDSLIIYSTACKIKKLNITGGFPNKRPKIRTLRLLSPNCNEVFAIGDTIEIQWEGLLPADVVQLQYSKNNGANWDTLAINVLGLKFQWWLDPQKFTDSDSMLVRIIQIWPNNAGETIELRHLGPVNTANFNRDASLIISGSNHPDDYASVWNPGTGNKLFSLKGHRKQVNWAVFDNTDRFAITASDDSTAIIWDVKTGDSLFTFSAHYGKVTSANFSPDGNFIVTSGTDGSCFVWNIQSKTITDTLSFRKNPIYFATFSPDTIYILLASYDGNIYAWNIRERKFTKTFKTNKPNNHIHNFSISISKNKLASASHLGLINVWEYDTSSVVENINPLFEMSHDTISYPAINTSYFNSTGSWLVTAGSDSRVLRWNPDTGELIDSIAIAEHSNSVTSATFSFDDAILMTSSWDSTLKIFNRTKLGLQIDSSDCPFSITKTSLLLSNVDFGLVPISQTKDTLVLPFGINTSKIPLKIKSVELFGPNSSDFKLIEFGNKNLIQRGDSIYAYFNFTPSSLGIKTAFIKIAFDGDSATSQLTGTGYELPLFQPYTIVDMGKVELGSYKDTLLSFALKNISKNPIEIFSVKNLGPDSLNFSIINGNQPITLLPQQIFPFTMRFTPDTIGRRHTIVEFETNSQVPKYYLQFFAEGIKPVFDSLTISIGEFEATPGEIIHIPVQIESRSFQYFNSHYEGIAFDLSFNKTMLEPLFPFSLSQIENNERKLHIEAKSNIYSDSVLITLDFRVGLGNDSTSPLTIKNSYPLGSGKITISEKSGLIRLINLCNEGGTRLFESDGRFWLSAPAPNPVENLASIEFETIESGYITLTLYNFEGSPIKTFLSGELKAGKYSFNFSVDYLPDGIYFLVLKSPNLTTIKTFQILK